MTEPLVSILIPVYNAGSYLRNSVRCILSQTYSNLEILIVDDGSTDRCMESIIELNDSRIRILTQKNAGRATALNRALENLSGEFYAIQDADDLCHPRRIERQVQCMLENPGLAAVFTGYEVVVNGRHLAPRFAAKNTEQCYLDNKKFHIPAHDPTAMFRLSIVGDMRYEPSLKVGAGYDYILRAGELHPMVVLGECLYSYRIHSGSTTRKDLNRREHMMQKVFRRACKRRGLQYTKYFHPSSVTEGTILYREQEYGVVPHFMESVLDLRHAGRHFQALRTALACLSLHYLDLDYYKPLAYFFAPMKLIKYYRKKKALLYD